MLKTPTPVNVWNFAVSFEYNNIEAHCYVVIISE